MKRSRTASGSFGNSLSLKNEHFRLGRIIYDLGVGQLWDIIHYKLASAK